MKLKKYLKEFGVSPLKLAALAEISYSTFYKVLTQQKDTRASILMKISLATKGVVSVEEMINMKMVNTKNKSPRRKHKQFELPLEVPVTQKPDNVYMRSIPEN